MVFTLSILLAFSFGDGSHLSWSSMLGVHVFVVFIKYQKELKPSVLLCACGNCELISAPMPTHFLIPNCVRNQVVKSPPSSRSAVSSSACTQTNCHQCVLYQLKAKRAQYCGFATLLQHHFLLRNVFRLASW